MSVVPYKTVTVLKLALMQLQDTGKFSAKTLLSCIIVEIAHIISAFYNLYNIRNKRADIFF